MTRPTRADQVRMTSAQASKLPPRQATMTAIDMEDDNLRPDAWFAYVAPVQSGVEMMAAGRYGYWETQPSVECDDNYVVITGRGESDGGPGEEEPIMVVPKASVISVMIAKANHINAYPIPKARLETGD